MIKDMPMADTRLIPPGIFNETTKVFNDLIDRIINLNLESMFLYDIEHMDEELLSYIANHFHVTNRDGWYLGNTVSKRRRLIKELFDLHRYKGTKYAIRKMLRMIGIHSEIVEWYETNRCIKGEFCVDINLQEYAITIEDRTNIIDLINQYKNVRSHLKDVGVHCRTRQELGVVCMQETTAYASMVMDIEYDVVHTVDIHTSHNQSVSSYAEMEPV